MSLCVLENFKTLPVRVKLGIQTYWHGKVLSAMNDLSSYLLSQWEQKNVVILTLESMPV